MTLPTYETPPSPNGIQTVDVVKWIATAIQLLGYGFTGMNIVPWNIFAFFAGIVLWLAVGVM